MKLKSTPRLRRILIRGILIVALVCVIGIVGLSLSVELGVRRISRTAMQAYPGDKIEALMMFVKPNEYGYDANLYRANNHAVWALGQLGDERALPFLRDLLTGQPCDHETNLCQGEIKKAIQKLETKGFNLPACLWRGILNDQPRGDGIAS